MANNSSLSKRAALRQQQEMDERSKRTKRIIGAGLGLLVVVAVVVLAIVIYQAIVAAGRGSSITENQLTPPNATANYGILMNGAAPTDDVPHLVVWEDFQCPACKSREAAYGPVVEQLAAEGSITVEIRTAYFLDGQKIDGSRVEDGSSKRAAIAAAAADAVGKYREYHKVVYDNQPTEGVGYKDAQLREDFAAQAGIEGDDLTKFQELYDTWAYNDFVEAADAKFGTDGIGSTPTYLVSGQTLEFYDQTSQQVLIQPTTDDFLRAVTEAWEAGGKSNDF